MVTQAPKLPKKSSREELCQRLAHNLRRIVGEQEDMAALGRRTGLCYRILLRVAKAEVNPTTLFTLNLSETLGVSVDELLAPIPPAKKSKK
jgi:hypothetical protein